MGMGMGMGMEMGMGMGIMGDFLVLFFLMGFFVFG